MAELKNALNLKNDFSMATLFHKVSTFKLICYNLKDFNSYYYDPTTTLYKKIILNELSVKIRHVLHEYLEKERTALKGVFQVKEADGDDDEGFVSSVIKRMGVV